jgi:alpha-tubulin suppressor-like RCC1 family protein
MPNFSGKWTLTEQAQGAAAGTWPLRFDYELYVWGNNTRGNLGQNNTVTESSPVAVGALNEWSVSNSGNQHVAAIKPDGTLWTWGYGSYGRLGQNSIITTSSPIQVGALTNWAKVSAGNNWTMAIKTDGTLWSWGAGTNGRTGLSTGANASSPTQVGTSSDWYEVDARMYHTLMLKTDGTLWACGRGGSGQLGQNSTTDRDSPSQVGALTNWAIARGGDNHSLAIKTDGSLWAWGNNSSGQIGTSTFFDTRPSSPVQVGGLTNWATVGAGYAHSLAVKTDGTLWAWGRGTSGQLGLSASTINRSSPVQVGGLTNWSIVEGTISGTASLSIKTDGTLWGWGTNNPPILGTGNVTSYSSPVQSGSRSDWISISSGENMSSGITKA